MVSTVILLWGLESGLQHYRSYGVGFFSRMCNFVNARVCIIAFIAHQVVCASSFRLQLVFS